jgi:hypothetical protein
MNRQEALKLADKHSKLTAGFLFNAVTVHEMIEEAIAIERKACLEIADQCAAADMHASMVANAIRARDKV